MKKLFLILTVVVFFACYKNGNEGIRKSNAVITGFDPNKCYCCWGWIIEIDNAVYKFDQKPASSSIDLENMTYPATVNIKWKSSAKSCSNWIDVISISQ